MLNNNRLHKQIVEAPSVNQPIAGCIKGNLPSRHDLDGLPCEVSNANDFVNAIYIKACIQNKAQLCASSACISGYVLSDKEQN